MKTDASLTGASTRLALAGLAAAALCFLYAPEVLLSIRVVSQSSKLKSNAVRSCAREPAAFNSSRFVILTFHSLGPPFDEGLNLQSSRAKFREMFSPHADDIHMSSPLQLENDPWWRAHFRTYPDTAEYLTPANKGANKIGYWKHKALLLYRATQREPLGTVIMYMDGNLERDPHLSYKTDKWRELSNYVLDQNAPADIWMGQDQRYRVKQLVKSYALRRICEPQHLERIQERPMMLAGRTIIRNTIRMQQMLRDEILPLFEDDTLLTPFPEGDRHPDFIFNTGDQGIWFPFLYQKRYKGELPGTWPKFAYTFKNAETGAVTGHQFTLSGLELSNDRN